MIKKLLIDTSKYLPGMVIPTIVGVIAIPIVTRLFSPVDYGNYVLVLSTVTVLAALVGWLDMSIIRFHPVYERDKKLDIFYSTVIKWLLISVLGISILFSTILFIGKNYISHNLYHLMMIGVGVFMCLSLFQVLVSFLRTKRLAGWYSYLISWKSIGTYVVGLGLILGFNFGIEGLLWGMIVSMISVVPWVWKKVLNSSLFLKRKLSLELSAKMVKYGFPLVVGNLAAWVLSLSDRYVLEFFKGAHEVGVYSASYIVGEHAILPITSLLALSYGPLSIHIWEKEGKEKSQIFINKLARYFLIICLPAVVGLSVLAKLIIGILVAQEYFEGYYVIPFVAFGIFFLGLQWIFATGLRYYEKACLIMSSIGIAAILNLGLNFLFIPRYGYLAAAITTFVSYAFLLLIIIIISRKFFAWSFPFRTLRNCGSASLIMGVAVYFLVDNLYFDTLVNLVLGILAGIMIYFILTFLFKEISPEEKNTVRQLIWKYILRKV